MTLPISENSSPAPASVAPQEQKALDLTDALEVMTRVLQKEREKVERLKRALQAIWDFSANATPSVDLLNSISATCCHAFSDVNTGDATRQN